MDISNTLETKFARFGEQLSVNDGAVIEGYASLFGLCDQGGDIVEAGAYTASLERLERKAQSVKMLWQHDPAQPIGVWDAVREDATGLWVRGRILEGVTQGREAMALLEAGAIDGLSIGYRTIRAAKNDKGQRLLTEVELWEVSLVTFPMLPNARVGSKSDATSDATSDADATLRDMAAAFRGARAKLAQR